jgi:hypothetical protein
MSALKNEALWMALGVLEFYYDLYKEKVDANVITAIKEALAQPEREWVGLTDEERDHFEGLHLYAARNQVEAWIEGVPAFIDAIEAKLREKNNG